MHCLGWICSFILQTHATFLFFWFVVRTFWRYCYHFLFVMYNWTSFQYWSMLDCSCLLRKKNSKEVGNKQRGYKWESREHWWTCEKNDGNKLTSRNKKQSAAHVPSFISFPSSAKQQGEMTSSGASGLRTADFTYFHLQLNAVTSYLAWAHFQTLAACWTDQDNHVFRR